MRAAYVLSAVLVLCGTAHAGVSPDMRGPAATTPHKHFYCVRNSEGGACEDCWSDGAFSSTRGTCRLLKTSTNAPNVRSGTCNTPANRLFCKIHQNRTGVH